MAGIEDKITCKSYGKRVISCGIIVKSNASLPGGMFALTLYTVSRSIETCKLIISICDGTVSESRR